MKVTVVIPKERMCWYAAHGYTYLRDWYGGCVVMEAP